MIMHALLSQGYTAAIGRFLLETRVYFGLLNVLPYTHYFPHVVWRHVARVRNDEREDRV